MKKFNSSELRSLRADIVLQKQSGLTIAEITEEMLPYCEDIDDASVLYNKVKCQWDNYVRAQKKALSDSDDEEELSKSSSETSNELRFSKAISESQKIDQNEDGSKDSTVVRQNRHLDKAISAYTKEDLLTLHGFIPAKEWELVSAHSSQWQAQAAGGEVVEMVSSKVSAVPASHEEEIVAQIIKSAKEKFGPIGKKHHPVPVIKEDAQEIAIAPLADFHLDKREADNALPFEAQLSRLYAIIDWFCEKFRARPNIAKIAFYWSQDFFNYDYLTQETTSRRNKQDATVGYCKMVQDGNKALVEAILELEKIAPVELFYTRSNHDQHTAFNTMVCLYNAFLNDENVLIDGMNADERRVVWDRMTEMQKKGERVGYDTLFDTAGRHYLMWGDVLLGFAHGDTEGNRIHNVMQVEADNQFARLYAKREGLPFDGNVNALPDFPEKFAWSKTRYHVFFCGHFHSKQKIVKDESGVEVIYLGTEMTGDAWHKNCGYIGAQQRVETYIYNKRGEYEILATQSAALKEDWQKKLSS